jgi:hypothetical protein
VLKEAGFMIKFPALALVFFVAAWGAAAASERARPIPKDDKHHTY